MAAQRTARTSWAVSHRGEYRIENAAAEFFERAWAERGGGQWGQELTIKMQNCGIAFGDAVLADSFPASRDSE